MLLCPHLTKPRRLAARVGDSWRNRYHSLCLHDPVWADHFPNMPFPRTCWRYLTLDPNTDESFPIYSATWPIYTPKDKIANWMEHYAGNLFSLITARPQYLTRLGYFRNHGAEHLVKLDYRAQPHVRFYH